jgi:hypothetical protein
MLTQFKTYLFPDLFGFICVFSSGPICHRRVSVKGGVITNYSQVLLLQSKHRHVGASVYLCPARSSTKSLASDTPDLFLCKSCGMHN